MTASQIGARAGVVIVLWMTSGVPTFAVNIVIQGPGERTYPIAVSSLKSSGPDSEQLSQAFRRVVARDLDLSGLFRVLPEDTHREPPDSGLTAETVDFRSWSAIGALAVVKGSISVEGDHAVVEARLFDVHQRRQLGGRRYRGVVDDVPRMGDRFADAVMELLTGQPGPFDSQIVFLSAREGRFKEVYSMRLHDREPRRITGWSTLNVAPSWSPDASSILVTSYRFGDPDLFHIDPLAGRWRRLTRGPGLDLGGCWSPDALDIAVAREKDGNSDIYLLRSDGSERRRVTDHRAIDVSPSWSPDGRRLAFSSDRAGSPQIYVVGRDGTNVQRVTRQGSYNTSPAWSPDGRRIAYVSRTGGRFQIFTVGVDGSDPTQVTSEGDNEDPSWSPDGRYLVFSSNRTGARRLFLADRSGRYQAELTRGRGDDSSPDWSGWLAESRP